MSEPEKALNKLGAELQKRQFALWATAQALIHTGLDQREELMAATRGVDGDPPAATKRAIRAVKADADRDDPGHWRRISRARFSLT